MNAVFNVIRIAVERLEQVGLLLWLRIVALVRGCVLIIVDGVPGGGKTCLSDLIERFYERCDVAILPKFKTSARAGESSVDTIPISEDEFTHHADRPDFFWYRFGKGGYGFFKHDLDQALLRSRIVVITLRSSAVIERLSRDYSFLRVKSVFIHADESIIRHRLAGRPADVVETRLRRTDEIWPDYQPLAYAHHIINHHTPEAFDQVIHQLLARYGATPASQRVEVIRPAATPALQPIAIREQVSKEARR